MSKPIDEHVMINRAELARIIMEAKGFSPEDYELVNMDLRSNELQRIFPLYIGDWSEQECPIDMLTFGVRKK